MKKILLLLFLAVASSPAAFAQARAGGELSSKDYTGGGTTDSRNTGFGVKGGYNLNQVYGDGTKDVEGLKSSNTFHAGLYGQLGFSEFSSLQVELLYSRKGYDLGGSENNVRLDYLQLPVLFVGNITETISFHVGPQISVLTKVTQGDKNLDIDENGFNAVDYGAVGGAEFRIGPGRIGARYDLGLARIFDEDKSGVKERVSNGTFQVYVGIGITQ